MQDCDYHERDLTGNSYVVAAMLVAFVAVVIALPEGSS
jgi:hypothetical protein